MTHAIPGEVVYAFANSEADLLVAASPVRNNFTCKLRALGTIGMATGESVVLHPLERTLRGVARGAESPLAVTTIAPAFPSGFVRRPRLVQRLTEARDAALALIVGPPGYGKTSLLSEWAERDHRDFLWLAIERGRRNSPRRTANAVTRLVRSVSGSHKSFVVVLDDAHLISARVLGELVDAAIAELPRGSTLAVVSRADPALPVGRLRAHRALVELQMHDLTLTSAEGAVLLRGAGVELEFETTQALVRRTEGWPAALYLAVESLRRQRELFGGVAHFSGNDHLLGDYVSDEILAALPADLRIFVLRSSVLDELSGPICDAALDQEGSGLILRQLARACPLLVSLDPEHDHFRWHRLLRETLEGELRRVEPHNVMRIHRRASDWFARNEHEERALQHAIAARDVARTGELLWPRIPVYLATGRCRAIRDRLASFSQAEIASSAPLALSAAHSCLASGDLFEAQHWALVAEARLEDGADTIPAGVQAGLALITAMLARGGAVQMREDAERAQSLEPADSPWRPVVCLVEGVAKHLTGDCTGAERSLQAAVDCGTVAAPAVVSLCLAQRAMIAIERGEWGVAAELADEATRSTERCGLGGDAICALVPAAAAAARAHDGRTDEAKQDLRRATDLLASLGEFLPWYGAQVRILLAHASLSLADVARARTLLAEASRLARRVPEATMFARWFDEAWAYLDTLAEDTLAGPSSLTIAELRILRFLPTHRSFREIATQLGVSRNTVKTQAHAVYRKLGVTSRSEAVAHAAQAGLLGQ